VEGEKAVGAMMSDGAMMGEGDHRDQTVELLRFVTAYGTGIETLVDLTPYSPLLQAGKESSKGLTAYAFIDTWVNNESGSDAMYMNNITEQCTPIVRSYGNGWSLSAELVFWPKNWSSSKAKGRRAAQPVVPKHSVTLSSGFYGGNFPLGRIRVHQGKMHSNSSAVLLENAVDFLGAAKAEVYECGQGKDEIEYAARLGFLAQQVEALVRKVRWAREHGVHLYFATQFCFEPEPIMRWEAKVRELLQRELGVEAASLPRIHLGVAGPAKIANLIKFATMSGVGESMQFVTKHTGNAMKLMSTAAPDELIVGIASYQASDADCLISAMHFYPFGGVQKTVNWANQVESGSFSFAVDGKGFEVE